MSRIVFRKDAEQTRVLVKSARAAAKRAYSGSKTLGLHITYIKDGVIYEEDENGNAKVINQIEVIKETPFELKKGLILHAK